MKKQQRRTAVILGICFTIVLIITAAFFSDFLGARFIRKGSPRLSVRQGEITTLELASSGHVRKLEICTEKRNLILGRSDFVECRTLKNFVDPHITEVGVIIPKNMPLGRAIVITRIRDIDNVLVPIAPTNEKITLWIDPPRQSGASSSGSSTSSLTSTITNTVRRVVGGGNPSSSPLTSPKATTQPTPTPPKTANSTPTPRPPTPTPTPTPPSVWSCYLGNDGRALSTYDLKWNFVEISPAILRSGSAVRISAEMQNIGQSDFPAFYMLVLYDKNNDNYTSQPRYNKYDDTRTAREGTVAEVGHYIKMTGLKVGEKRHFSYTISNTTISVLQTHVLQIHLNTPPAAATDPYVSEGTYSNNHAHCGFEMYP